LRAKSANALDYDAVIGKEQRERGASERGRRKGAVSSGVEDRQLF
jgi:hypothetical protein